jgi:hypothetical protein
MTLWVIANNSNSRHGAKWVPRESDDIKQARRELLKLEPDYTVEFPGSSRKWWFVLP